MVAVQQQVYRLQGSLNKLVMDDKGSTLICIFGLPPFAHFDDADRALFTGFNLIKTLSTIEDTYCNIGVSSGECFSGIVGTSGSRKEFSVLGDVVNLAARIMGSFKKLKIKNQVLCDLNTSLLASSSFEFEYMGHHELKGKSISIPFYRPIDPQIRLDMAANKLCNPHVFLKIKQNPMNLERNNDNKHEQIVTFGFEAILENVTSEVKEYLTTSKYNSPLLQVIRGEIGSGKTAFMRQIIDEIHKFDEFKDYIRDNNGKLPILTSKLSVEEQLVFLNAWRPILRMALSHHCKKTGTNKAKFLADVIIKSGNHNKVDLLCELLGVSKKDMGSKRLDKMNVPQIKALEHPYSFV